LLIGSSFVFKKGLLRSQAGGELGEGFAYLKSVSGMSSVFLGLIKALIVDRNDKTPILTDEPFKVVIIGEICNVAGIFWSFSP